MFDNTLVKKLGFTDMDIGIDALHIANGEMSKPVFGLCPLVFKDIQLHFI